MVFMMSRTDLAVRREGCQTTMPNQQWNPTTYNANAHFVPTLGKQLLELLNPQKGERILDLGCGDGTLTKELVREHFNVVGIDASPEMIRAAQANGVDAILLDAENMFNDGAEDIGKFDNAFDAVVSNAALHWMNDHYAVVRNVWRALKPGGRFVAECGGEGCIRIIREGMKIALAKRGVDYKSRNPWKYPELGMFSKILENQGFKVGYIARIDRPTPLPTGLRGWLDVFANAHTRGFSPEEREQFYLDVEDYCSPRLLDKEKGWIADYVRLRFLAEKPKS